MSEQTITDQLNRVLRQIGALSKQPRYRYFETSDGWMFGWTVERAVDDSGRERYQSFIYQPKGKGARSGSATRWVLRRAASHATRRAAKARAYRLYRDRKLTLIGRPIARQLGL